MENKIELHQKDRIENIDFTNPWGQGYFPFSFFHFLVSSIFICLSYGFIIKEILP